MEVIGGEFYKCKSSDSAIQSTITKSKSRNLSASDVGYKMELGKKRGVYVEKWVNPKHAEDKEKNPKSNAQPTPRPQTHKLLTSAPAASKISTYTRLLGTADPVVRFVKRKPKKTLPEKLPKQSSKTSSTKPSKHDMPRNIVEENKKLKNIRSHAHKLQPKDSENDTTFKSEKEIIHTPTTSSRINQNSSYEATWSAIFPKESLANTYLLQQYVCKYEQTVDKTNDKELDEKVANKGKDEPIYNFFVDLLESVYDDDIVAKNPDTLGKSSDITFEIDDHVAQKLQSQEESSNHYTIKDDLYDQSRQLADYYNKSRLIPLIPLQRKKKRNKCNHKPASKGKPIKPNLLNLLKQQLSLDFDMHQEPESMYEALLNIAKNKRKRKQIYFEGMDESSEIDRFCRFKRRNVISPSTRLPKHSRPTNNFNSINSTTAKYRTGSVTSTNAESSHSLEVLGFDYDESDIVEPETDYSDTEIAVNTVRPIPNLNEGIMTVIQNWKH